jgi:hypothetical protein
MAAVVEMLKTFTSDVDCPTGAIGFKAYLPVMTELFPEGRRRITLDSASPAHVREFTRVLKLAMEFNPTEFAKATITKASGVTQTAASKHAALIPVVPVRARVPVVGVPVACGRS